MKTLLGFYAEPLTQTELKECLKLVTDDQNKRLQIQAYAQLERAMSQLRLPYPNSGTDFDLRMAVEAVLVRWKGAYIHQEYHNLLRAEITEQNGGHTLTYSTTIQAMSKGLADIQLSKPEYCMPPFVEIKEMVRLANNLLFIDKEALW